MRIDKLNWENKSLLDDGRWNSGNRSGFGICRIAPLPTTNRLKMNQKLPARNTQYFVGFTGFLAGKCAIPRVWATFISAMHQNYTKLLIFHWFFRPLAVHMPISGPHAKINWKTQQKKPGNISRTPVAHHRRVSQWMIWSDSFDHLKNPASKSY